jgi:hypothetical protein
MIIAPCADSGKNHAFNNKARELFKGFDFDYLRSANSVSRAA